MTKSEMRSELWDAIKPVFEPMIDGFVDKLEEMQRQFPSNLKEEEVNKLVKGIILEFKDNIANTLKGGKNNG